MIEYTSMVASWLEQKTQNSAINVRGPKRYSETFDICDLHVTRILHHGIYHDIPSEEKDTILGAIVKSCQLLIGKKQDVDIKQLLALASDPIIDALDDRISHRCNWIILSKDRAKKIKGLILDYYYRENNQRFFCYGDKEVLTEFIKLWPFLEERWGQQPDDFRLVLPTWQFDREELPGLIDGGVKWNLRGEPEEAIRLYLPLSNMTNFDPIPIKPNFQLVDVGEEHVPSVMKLLEENYHHHSFRSPPVDHKGIIDLNTGEVVALSGILGQAIIPSTGSITSVGNSVVDNKYRGQGLAKAVITATLNQIKSLEKYKDGVVVADANRFSLPLYTAVGFKQIPIDSGVAKFWWCIYK